MKVAIYARYSSDNQRDASIEDQIRLCRERAEHDGWTVVEAYTDHAISGASLIRPGVQALLSDAAQGKFGAILAEALDRLSRDQEDIAGLYKRMAFAGVKIVTLSEGEVTNLHVGLKGTMNALFLQDLADKTRRGLRGRVEAGKSGGGNAYGYRVVRKIDAAGEAVTGERAIDEAEAAVVRRIFRDFAAGTSPRAIARALNDAGIPGPGGRVWMDTTIRGSARRGNGILNNELYIGRIVWNRQRFIKDPDTGKRVSRPNPENKWVVQEVPALRIVDQAVWDQVKERQAATKRTSDDRETAFWDRKRPRYLFSGLVKCGVCGGGMSVISKTHLGCSTARNKGTCDNWLTRRRDAVEAEVLDGLKSRLMDPDLFDIFCEEWTRHLNQVQMAKSAHLAGLRAELERCERELKKIVQAIKDGVPGSVVKDDAIRHQSRKEQIQQALQSADEPVMLMHPKMAAEYRRKVRGLIAALNKENGRAEAGELIRALLDRIVLTPVDGKLAVDLEGDLAGVMALATGLDSKKPLRNRGLELSQIKVVAGAHSHLKLLFQAAA
jgi:DNA invertase Pin-like site-specific DNA recombinase